MSDYFADQARVTERLGIVRFASLNRISKDLDPPSPTNRFPTKPRSLYNLHGGFTSASRSRISEDLGPPPLTALHNRRPHRNLTKQPPRPPEHHLAPIGLHLQHFNFNSSEI
jgi:hypothetical protein